MPGGFCVSTGEFINVAPGADYEERLEEAILDLGINAGDDDIECYVETTRMSLSPSSCDETTAEDMYKLTLRDTESEEKILHEMSQDGEIRISFGIDNALYNFLIRTYQYINFHHPIIEMIDAEATAIHRSENWMTVRAVQGVLYLLAYKNRTLQLANGIETMVTQNRSYHVLNTWTILNLDVLNDTLYIIGDESEALKLKNAVSKFIKQCE